MHHYLSVLYGRYSYICVGTYEYYDLVFLLVIGTASWEVAYRAATALAAGSYTVTEVATQTGFSATLQPDNTVTWRPAALIASIGVGVHFHNLLYLFV